MTYQNTVKYISFIQNIIFVQLFFQQKDSSELYKQLPHFNIIEHIGFVLDKLRINLEKYIF